eukprot:195704-Rhodomonas_salina.1
MRGQWYARTRAVDIPAAAELGGVVGVAGSAGGGDEAGVAEEGCGGRRLRACFELADSKGEFEPVEVRVGARLEADAQHGGLDAEGFGDEEA